MLEIDSEIERYRQASALNARLEGHGVHRVGCALTVPHATIKGKSVRSDILEREWDVRIKGEREAIQDLSNFLPCYDLRNICRCACL